MCIGMSHCRTCIVVCLQVEGACGCNPHLAHCTLEVTSVSSSVGGPHGKFDLDCNPLLRPIVKSHTSCALFPFGLRNTHSRLGVMFPEARATVSYNTPFGRLGEVVANDGIGDCGDESTVPCGDFVA